MKRKNDIKENLREKVFIVIFMLILIVPFLTMNFKPKQTSNIDNKVLTEFPDFHDFSSETIRQIEDYVNDRVGFREQSIALYTRVCDKFFNVMIHPLFMYGKENHIYYKDKDYVAAYQRLNTDEEYLHEFTDFLVRTKEYLDGKNIKFVYFLCPDKKTIYPEYFPDSVHVKTDNKTVIEAVEDDLTKTDIDWIIPKDQLLEAKKSQVVYNKKYDATHWNEFGSILAQKMLDEKIRSWYPEIRPLTEEDFSLEYVTMKNLDNSDFPINDEVPVYTLLSDTSQDATEMLESYLDIDSTTFYAHFLNPNVQNDKVLLIFTDSYFATYHKFYNNRYREVYYVHRSNFEYLQYIVDLVFPSVVVFETAERSITSEMKLLAEFSDYYYEPAYKGNYTRISDAEISGAGLPDVKTREELAYTLTAAKGVRIDGNKIFINPEGGDNIVSIQGVMNDYNATKDLNLYMYIQGNYIETDYCKQNRQAEEDGLKKFSMNVQRRYFSPGEIQLLAVDEETGYEYVIETFEISYGE